MDSIAEQLQAIIDQRVREHAKCSRIYENRYYSLVDEIKIRAECARQESEHFSAANLTINSIECEGVLRGMKILLGEIKEIEELYPLEVSEAICE